MLTNVMNADFATSFQLLPLGAADKQKNHRKMNELINHSWDNFLCRLLYLIET